MPTTKLRRLRDEVRASVLYYCTASLSVPVAPIPTYIMYIGAVSAVVTLLPLDRWSSRNAGRSLTCTDIV